MTTRKLCLGKAPAQHDDRTIKLATMLRSTLAPPPATYDFDAVHPGLDTPMFLNDELGCCVIAGRSHMTRRFELVEQGTCINITDDEVKSEYFRESGGQDSGLNMLQSLKAWRHGWRAAGRLYNIFAFMSVHPQDTVEVKQCIALLNGCYVGVALPNSAQDQLGKVWDVTKGPDAVAGTWGGHCILICGYTEQGPVCITWGARQQMTWAWFGRYCDEAYGIVDAADRWLAKPGINVAALASILSRIVTD